MTRLWNEIDLHVVAIWFLTAPGLCFSGWWLLVLLLLPQGRIFVRAFSVNPSSGLRRWTYLAVNELVVVGLTGAAGWLWLVVRR